MKGTLSWPILPSASLLEEKTTSIPTCSERTLSMWTSEYNEGKVVIISTLFRPRINRCARKVMERKKEVKGRNRRRSRRKGEKRGRKGVNYKEEEM
jgi:hypothetical protein